MVGEGEGAEVCGCVRPVRPVRPGMPGMPGMFKVPIDERRSDAVLAADVVLFNSQYGINVEK